MRLIDNWRSAWRWYSQWANFATVAVSLVAIADFTTSLLPIWRGFVEPETYMLLTAITGTAALIGRMLKQELTS